MNAGNDDAAPRVAPPFANDDVRRAFEIRRPDERAASSVSFWSGSIVRSEADAHFIADEVQRLGITCIAFHISRTFSREAAEILFRRFFEDELRDVKVQVCL